MNFNFRYVFLLIFTFLFVYYPPIFFANTLHILAVIAWGVILTRRNFITDVMIKSGYLKEIFFAMALIGYLYLFLLVNGKEDILIGYFFIILIIEVLPIAYTVVYLLSKYDKKNDLSMLLLNVGLLQSMLSLAAFMIPSFQLWFINTIIDYGYKEIVVSLSSYRMYGVSYTLPFSMPIVQSVLAVLSIYIGVNRDKKVLLYTPFIIFSAVINARISLVIIIIGLILIVVNSLKKSVGNKLKITSILVIAILLSSIIGSYIEKSASKTYMWLTDGINQIVNLLFYGEKTGTYANYITSANNYSLPDGLSFLYGTSERVIRGNSLFQSDIGYVNDIWLGGIIYSLLIYSYLMFKLIDISKMLNYLNREGTLIAIFLSLVFLLVNVKGTIFKLNEFLNLFYLIFVYSSYQLINKRKTNEVSD